MALGVHQYLYDAIGESLQGDSEAEEDVALTHSVPSGLSTRLVAPEIPLTILPEAHRANRVAKPCLTARMRRNLQKKIELAVAFGAVPSDITRTTLDDLHAFELLRLDGTAEDY